MKTEERPDLPARFFKIILPSVDSRRKLRIPDKFVEKYGHELSDVVTLTDPTSAVSYVSLEKIEKTLWLHDGWEKFVDDHFISYGYFLLFKYKGNSTFNVNILDLTATEVDYSLNNNRNFERTNHSTRNSISEKEENSDDESDEVLAFFPGKPNECGVSATNNRRHYHQTTQDLSFSSEELPIEVKKGKSDAAERSKSQHRYRTRSKCKIEDERIKTQSKKPKNITIKNVQEAIPCTEGNRQSSSNENLSSSRIKSGPIMKTIDSAAKYLPINPSFTVKLKRNNLSPHFWMYVPVAFSQYMPSAPGLIVLLDSDGQKWPVRVMQKKGGKDRYLSKGWKAFAKLKNLKVGNTCVFELIDINKRMLKRIANKFVGKCGHQLSNVVRLFDPIASVWCARLEKMETTPRFDDGSEKFVEDHFVSFVNFLLFNYRGHLNYAPFLTFPCLSLLRVEHNLVSEVHLICIATEYLPIDIGHVEFHNSDGKKWLVRVIQRKDNESFIIRGWKTFAKDRNLKVGDTCVFELIRMNKPMLKVSSFCNMS